MKHCKLSVCMGLSLFLVQLALCAEPTVQSLLEGYLENDLSLKQLSASVEKQRLSSELTKLGSGFDVQLSTGTITIRTGENGSVSFRPSAEASLPQASNLGVSVGSSVSISGGEASASDTSISVSADIISSAMSDRNVTLLRSERQVLEAERKLSDGYLSAERQFYSELRALYQAAANIVSNQRTLYEDKLSFEQVSAQGYAQTSSKYRTAYMQVVSDEHTVSTAERELDRKVAVFAAKCGVPYTSGTAMDFLPASIPQVEAVDVLSFSKDDFSSIESAEWSHRINSLSRDGDKSISLTAAAGFTFDNSATKSNTVDASARFSWSDTLSVTGGVSVPVGADSMDPTFTVALTVNPFGIKKSSIQNQITGYSELQEQLDIQSAEADYETAVVNQQSSLADILWSKQMYAETYEQYELLAADTERWYRQGVVSESEYRAALANRERARLNCLMTDIELLMYNNETQLLFCRDGE